jgi:hypothetical protein
MTQDQGVQAMRFSKRYVRVGLLIAAILFALQAYLCFTSAAFYLAMLRYHGREKSGSQRYYADKLIALGPTALPVLTEELFSHESKRYNPKVYEMLSQIPAGRQHLRQELLTINGSDADRRKVLLIYALIIAYGDWEYFLGILP